MASKVTTAGAGGVDDLMWRADPARTERRAPSAISAQTSWTNSDSRDGIESPAKPCASIIPPRSRVLCYAPSFARASIRPFSRRPSSHLHV